MKDKISEILQRLVRIETRLTRYLNDRGFDTGTDKPYFTSDDVIIAPSPNVRMADLLDLIPLSRCGKSISVFVGQDRIAVISREIDYDR